MTRGAGLFNEIAERTKAGTEIPFILAARAFP